MNIFSFGKGQKSRKYLVRLDEEGRSLRQQTFALFDQGLRPMQVCKQLQIKPKTCLRYWADWKKSPPNLAQRYRFLRKALKNDSGLREQTIESLADYYHISRDEVIRRLQKPHGLKQLLLNKWPALYPDEGIIEVEDRLRAALTLIDIVNTGEESYSDLNDLLNQLLEQKRENRQSAQVDQTDDDNNYRYPEPMGRFQRRPRPRFDPLKMTPEQQEQVKQYLTRKQEKENFKFYSDFVFWVSLFGISEEKVDEVFWQAVEKSYGSEKTAEFREQIKNMKKSIANNQSNHSDKSAGKGTA